MSLAPQMTVLIPTWRRPDALRVCLKALTGQTRLPSEILIVARPDDSETHAALADPEFEALPIRVVPVARPGQTAALNSGLRHATGDTIAITDDDTAPHPQWLERIQSHFDSDPPVGGVGGRDWVYHDGVLDDGAAATVGKVQWFGRFVGNHHIGVGEAREVDILKGANMSYRSKAIENLRFDETLLGDGAQIHNDMAFSLSVKGRGWKLIYDPLVAVDHFPGARYSIELRSTFNGVAWTNYIHNQTRILLMHCIKGPSTSAFVLWSILVGTREAPGILQFVRLLLMRDPDVVGKFLSSARGRIGGFLYYRRLCRGTNAGSGPPRSLETGC